MQLLFFFVAFLEVWHVQAKPNATVGTGQESAIYQVLSQDPHHLKILKQHIKTYKKEGRLWLVTVSSSLPRHGFTYLKKMDADDLKSVKHYNYRHWNHSNRPNYPNQSHKKRVSKKLNIVSRLKDLDKERIRQTVIQLSSYNSRAAGSLDNQQVEKELIASFQRLNLQTKSICYQDKKCSIIAERRGIRTPKEVILIMAHFDSVGKSFAGSDDNASGTAVLLEIAQSLSTYANNKTIRFLATNGEELGLLGAKHYVKYLESEGELPSISLAINMDMVGYNKNGIVELETNKPYEQLAQWFAQLAILYTQLETKITLGAWGSDHVPFLEKDVPTLLTIEDWSTKTPCYHQACDKPETLNYDYALEIAKLNAAAIMEHDKKSL